MPKEDREAHDTRAGLETTKHLDAVSFVFSAFRVKRYATGGGRKTT